MSTDAPLSLPDDPVLLKQLLLREQAQSAAVTAHLQQTVQSQQKKIDQQQHEISGACTVPGRNGSIPISSCCSMATT